MPTRIVIVITSDEPISTDVDRSISTEEDCPVCGQTLPHGKSVCMIWLRQIQPEPPTKG